MTEKFTASNGVEITLTNDRDETYLLGKGEVMPGGEVRWTVPTGCGEGVAALREFFQHERDQELGRWRWPENPDYVVYPIRQLGALGKPAARLLRESSCDVSIHGRNDSGMPEPVRAYFAAHPEPKPWHDAKPGEVWVLDTAEEGDEHAWSVDPDFGGGRFVYVGGLSNIPLDHPDITAGRRIWPEVSGDV